MSDLGVKEYCDIGVAVGTLALAGATVWLGRLTKKVATETHSLANETRILAKETHALAVDAEKSSYRQIGAQMWLSFREEFDSQEMVKARNELAKMLRQPSQMRGFDEKVTQLTREGRIPELLPNFFEDIGIADKKNFIDHEMAMETFSYYCWRWNVILRRYIEISRTENQGDKTLYEQFDNFAKKSRRYPGANVDKAIIEDLNRFLKSEAELIPPVRLSY